jgi:hypothetical protein
MNRGRRLIPAHIFHIHFLLKTRMQPL